MPYTRPMTFEERHSHNDMGTNLDLLTPEHRKKYEAFDFYRAGGGVVCTICNKLYYDHPNVVGALWLTEICNRDLVKL